jgi:endoribonuclease Dicer
MIHEYPKPLGAVKGKSGRYTKVKAALLAAEELEGLPAFEFRSKYGCDCRLDSGEGGLTAE